MDTCKGNGHLCPHHLILCAVSSSVSMEGSVAETHDEMLQVLKEKMRLEGQLEALTQEASQVRGFGERVVCHVLPDRGGVRSSL